MGVAYPKRDDAAVYEMFDGTLRSAQIISRLTRDNVHIKIDPSAYVGDVLSQIELGTGAQVKTGWFVVVKDESIAVHEPNDFHAAYSKDGN